MSLTFAELRHLSGNMDVTDVPCPLCVSECKTNEGRKRKCLRIWDSGEEFISYSCARCSATGYAKPDDNTLTNTPKKIDKQPVQKDDKTELCQFLWNKSVPAIGSLAQTYLQNRACCPPHMPISIRFLPQSGKYPPTMISRFGFEGEPLTGIHLTKLLPDGSGKDPNGPAKLTMGDTIGQPIVIQENDEKQELIISEGIEDTGSLAIVTGWNAWAAGTAGRIPAVVATATKSGFKRIYVTQDADNPSMATQQAGAGRRALEQALSVYPGLIPLPLNWCIHGTHMDANKILMTSGPEYLLTAIEWCEQQRELRTIKSTPTPNPIMAGSRFFHQKFQKSSPQWKRKLEKIASR